MTSDHTTLTRTQGKIMDELILLAEELDEALDEALDEILDLVDEHVDEVLFATLEVAWYALVSRGSQPFYRSVGEFIVFLVS